MKLQQLQLQELADWLTKAESKMGSASDIGSDLDTVKQQVEEHKGFQEDLENQQHHVNSLSHMVVVVDESESENATADLEEQLALLGERWSTVCKWTEHRYTLLSSIYCCFYVTVMTNILLKLTIHFILNLHSNHCCSSPIILYSQFLCYC